MSKRVSAEERQAQIRALLRQVGVSGMTHRELAAATGMHQMNTKTHCNRMRNAGELARVGGRFMLLEYLPPGVAQDGARVCAPDAGQRMVPGQRRDYGIGTKERTVTWREPAPRMLGDLLLPAGARVTVIEAPPPRYAPPPDYVGEFTRQWRQARA